MDDMVTSGGNPNPPVANRVFWGVSEGAAAAVLLMAGGLQALQSASISAGLPQSMLLLVACAGLVKTLRIQENLQVDTHHDENHTRKSKRIRHKPAHHHLARHRPATQSGFQHLPEPRLNLRWLRWLSVSW